MRKKIKNVRITLQNNKTKVLIYENKVVTIWDKVKNVKP